MSTASVSNPTYTAEEFFALPGQEGQMELVRGRILRMPPAGFRRGYVCSNVAFAIRTFLGNHPLGRVVGNDAGVITQRKPDTVRGPDVAYYSYEKIPATESPAGYPDTPPNLVIEVKSPSDSWNDLLVKVSEFLKAGVTIVCVIDPERELAQVYHTDEPVRIVDRDGVIEFPDVLPEFRMTLEEVLR